MTKINNVPDYAKTSKYIVYKEIHGDNWFYGAWDDVRDACRAASELNLIVKETVYNVVAIDCVEF